MPTGTPGCAGTCRASGPTARRDKAGVPEALQFATKPQIALQQIAHLMGQGAPRHCVLADAGYGVDTAFRARLSELGLGGTALPQHHPQSIKELALELGPVHWHTVIWREGTNTRLRSRFARVRVRAAHRDNLREELREPEWLLIEWPKGDAEPLKYWLSTLPEDTPLARMVFEAKMRWRIERDYQDLKQDLGLGHYEGRGWRGFHHHASLSIAAYGFLLAQRLGHPDEAGGKKNSAQRQEPALPTHYKPRASPAHAAPRPILDHELAAAYRLTPGSPPASMSLLPSSSRRAN
jgi:SRSO17 transposase